MNAQEKLNERFSAKHAIEFEDNWNKRPFKYSSWSLMYKVEDHESVIDVGCGTNPFKGKIKNLVGIDPVKVSNDNVYGADVVTTLEDFKTDQKFDVAFCLGSIQFGDEDYIIDQIEKVIALLKPKARIYWRHRVNGIATYAADTEEQYDDEYFIWTFEKMEEFATKFGFEQKNDCIEPNLVTNDERMYAEWHRR